MEEIYQKPFQVNKCFIFLKNLHMRNCQAISAYNFGETKYVTADSFLVTDSVGLKLTIVNTIASFLQVGGQQDWN